MARTLEQIIDDFDEFRESFKIFRNRGNVNRSTLLEYEYKLIELKADLRPHRKKITGAYQKRDDKAATGIKFRIAISIHEGTFKDKEGNLIYDPCSINQAEKYAAGSDAYNEFLDQRSFYKESLVNVNDLRNDMESFINFIKDMLKSI